MMKINFGAPQKGEHHSCESIREGDWIIFRCHQCPDYERRFNQITGKMKSKGTKPDVWHSSNYSPPKYPEAFENLN